MTTPQTYKQDSANDPILNPSHQEPAKHWALDSNIQAQSLYLKYRRPSEQIPIIPGSGIKTRLLEPTEDDPGQHWPEIPRVNQLRREVRKWQADGYPGTTDITRQLLNHWIKRQPQGDPDRRLYFAQLEAALTHIYLKESKSAAAATHRAELRAINESSNHGLNRLGHKMATGTGKTLTMAMLILWQSGNYRYNPEDYSNRILIFTPGLIVRERLMESLQPHPPNGQDSDYRRFNLAPHDDFWEKALNDTHIQIHNFHRFQPHRADDPLSRHAAELIAANRKDNVIRERLETRQETASRLTGLPLNNKQPIFVINDEGHHCHSGPNHNKPNTWLQGLLTLNRQHPILTAADMSATPVYFAENAANPPLFEWIVSDYPLIEAMEAGLVKIPQAPFNFKDAERYLNIYQSCLQEERAGQPRASNKTLTFRWKDADPPNCATLHDAMNLLYADYAAEYRQWAERYPNEQRPATVPGNPVMAVIMNSIANANAMFEFLTDPGKGKKLFRNLPTEPPRTIILHSRIDQDQDNAGTVDKEVRANARPLAAAYRRHYPNSWTDNATDDDILRDVLTTVGKPGLPGEKVRCVVSVNMLTEGWDARNVTHILGFRAFQSGLLCEQAAGRALRRVAYDYEEKDPPDQARLKPEYATIMGIPFPGMLETNGRKDGSAVKRNYIQVGPSRAELNIALPNIIRLQRDDAAPAARIQLKAHPEPLTPALAPAATTAARVETIPGRWETLQVYTPITRGNFLFKTAAAVFGLIVKEHQALTGQTAEIPALPLNRLFAQLQQIAAACADQGLLPGPADRGAWSDRNTEAQRAAEWLHRQLEIPGTLPPADSQTVRMRAIPHHNPPVIHARSFSGRPIAARHAYPESADRKTLKSPISHAICDSGWEVEVARLLDQLPPVHRWLRNYGLNWSLPYIADGEYHQYRPDFVAVCPLANGPELHLVIEVKGQELFNDRIKRDWAEHWCAAVNAHPDFRQNQIWQYLYLDELPRREYVEHQINAAIAQAPPNGA